MSTTNSRGREFEPLAVAKWLLIRIVALVVLAFFIFPLLWVLLTSIKTRVDAFASPPVWLFKPTFDAYVQLLLERDFLINVWSSVFVAVLNSVLVLAVSLPAAWSMARFDTGGRDLLMYILSIRFLPPIVIIPPMFIEMNVLSLVGTRYALIILYLLINIPFAVWLLRAAFQNVPESFIDAAKMDGATEFEIFYYVGLPMVKPAMITVLLISFIFSWNEFIFAIIFTAGDSATAPVALSKLITGREVFWNQIMAGATILILPLLLMGYIGQRYIIRGMTFGAAD
jgi:ABC-type glycerol-3-phosphate transport system permease component